MSSIITNGFEELEWAGRSPPACGLRGSRPVLAPWLAAAVLVCGCGRASLSKTMDAAVEGPVAMDLDDGRDATGWEAADDASDASARETRRDAPVDATPDGPCQPGFGLCPAGTAASTCLDLRSQQNCGACGRGCPSQTTCEDGACVSICPAGTTVCPGLAGSGCVNLADTQEHCGRCGHPCAEGLICRDATCQPACQATLSWDLPEMTPMPSSYGLVTMGDLDGDGALDCASTLRNSLQLWRNQGSGRFQPWAVDLPVFDAAERISSAGLGDFNGDGRLDLMVALYGDSSSDLRSFVLLASTAHGFQRVNTSHAPLPGRTGAWAVADMDGDGRADLVVGARQQISVWLGQVDGSLTEVSRIPHASNSYSLLVADLNGDGRKDVVADASSPSALQVYLGLGHGQFAPAVGSPQSDNLTPLVADDLDGDGTLELVANTTKGALLLHATKDGQLVDPQPLVDDFPLINATFFDLNGDGELDFISHTEGQELRIAFGDGKLGFASPQRYACPYSTTLTVEDFDGDGHHDLAMYSDYPEALLVLRGRDRGFPGFRIDPEAQDAADDAVWSGKDPVVADLNEDGIPDIAKLTANRSTLEVALGGGVDAGAITVSYPVSAASGLLILDLDMDGHQDLVVPSEPEGTITILRGRGDGTFEQRLSIPVAIPSSSAIAFSQPHAGRGRDLLQRRAVSGVPTNGPIGIAISTGSTCPSRTGP